MIYLLIFFAVCILVAAQVYKKAGSALCFVTLFCPILALLMWKANVTGIKLAATLLLSLLVAFRGVSTHNVHKEGNFLTYSIFTLMILIFTTDFFLKTSWSASVQEDVSQILINYLQYVVLPFLLVFFFVTEDVLYDYIHSLQKWGLIYVILLFTFFALSGIDVYSRIMLFEEDSALNSIGVSRMAILPLIASVFILNEGYGNRLVNIFTIIISALLILLCAQRGCLIGIMIALVIYVLLDKTKMRIGYKILLVMSSILLVIVLVNTNLFGIADRFSLLSDVKNTDIYRYDAIIQSWELFKSNGFLFGLGTNGYTLNSDGVLEYAHNFILECMVEYGILGLILSLCIVIGGIVYSVRIFKMPNKEVWHNIIPCIWLAETCSVMVSSNIVGGSLFIPFSALLALEYDILTRNQKMN